MLEPYEQVCAQNRCVCAPFVHLPTLEMFLRESSTCSVFSLHVFSSSRGFVEYRLSFVHTVTPKSLDSNSIGLSMDDWESPQTYLHSNCFLKLDLRKVCQPPACGFLDFQLSLPGLLLISWTRRVPPSDTFWTQRARKAVNPAGLPTPQLPPYTAAAEWMNEKLLWSADLFFTFLCHFNIAITLFHSK